ncbi:MAG: SUMF1/EgtB/PvdO family nonheme iron enzyme [Candidatus Sulfotelmatobacter sp.]
MNGLLSVSVTVLLVMGSYCASQDTKFAAASQQIPSPSCLSIRDLWTDDPECGRDAHKDWLADIRHWRDERRIRIGYDGSRYELPALQWTQSSFIQPLLMVEDRYFYDPVAHRYTVDRYLDDLVKRYGGIDAVLIWPTYPNMGVDDRNQHDMIRSMPGGIEGVKQMVADFHRAGVRVFFPMMMWDQGTRDPGMPWPEAIAKLMKEIGADGINGDTEEGIARAFPEAADLVGHPMAFEPEDNPADEAVAYNLLTWGQYDFPFAPEVDRYKWLEPRHMVNISDRWNRTKTDDLQFAFFNGVGWESWENLWGIWNGITPRDAEATRRVAAIERGIAPFLVSKKWEPLAPMLRFGVFASRWPLGENTVWTIVNRNEYDVSGSQIELAAAPDTKFFDLYHGVELVPQRRGEEIVLNFDIEANGYGALLASRGAPDPSLQVLMTKMHAMTGKPLTSYANQWKVLPQQLVPIAATKIPTSAPANMVKVPEGDLVFKVNGIEIEGGDRAGVDVQYPWEDSPRRFHEQRIHVKSFWIDKYPVTNLQFKEFVNKTHYQPQDTLNFLRDWENGSYPEGWGNKPVTWVSLEDARVYASWAGKRLPHEWEWQYSAQGTDARTYPWGSDWNENAVPVPDKARTMRGPDVVDAHPLGASQFGVMDLVGNVWQWTDEFVDEHTRAGIVRGGSYYQPQGSVWYFPQGYRLSEHGKVLLMAPSKDRSGAIGFRCVMDAQE